MSLLVAVLVMGDEWMSIISMVLLLGCTYITGVLLLHSPVAVLIWDVAMYMSTLIHHNTDIGMSGFW